MNSLDLLLKIDRSKMQRPSKEIEITRLTNLVGEPFIVKCQALLPEEYTEIQDNVTIDVDGKIDTGDIQGLTVLKGMVEPNLKSAELKKHYGSPTPKELLKKIFLPGEISKIYTTITELSGFNKDAVKDIKNELTQMEK